MGVTLSVTTRKGLPVSAEIESLRAELESLREENRRLKSAAASPDRSGRQGLWRAIMSTVCLVLAGVLVTVSILGSWARAQLVDESAFVSTFAPLAEDPDVQDFVIDQAVTAINDSLDVEQFTDDLFAGIATLDLPESAQSALALLRGPAAAGVRGLIESGVTAIVRSEAFPAIWRTALVSSHRGLVAAATLDDSGTITLDADGSLGIQLGPIIEQLKTMLTERGIGIADLSPTIDRVIVIAQADSLLMIGVIYTFAATIGWWLPVVTLALLVGGILLARRRPLGAAGAGIAVAVGAGVLALVLGVGRTVIGVNAPGFGVPTRTMDAITSAVLGAMSDTAVVFTFLGIVMFLAGWLAGRSRAAARARALATSLSASGRDALADRGLDTGRFGLWLRRQRILVRVLILVAAILLLFALRPLSIGDIVLTVLLALAVWLVAVLLEREDPGSIPSQTSQ